MRMYKSKLAENVIINNTAANVSPSINIHSLIVPPEIDYDSTSLVFHTFGGIVTWSYNSIGDLNDDIEDIKLLLKKYNSGNSNFSIH